MTEHRSAAEEARRLPRRDRDLFLRRRAERGDGYTVADFEREQRVHFERMRRKGFTVVDADDADAWC